MFNNPPSTSPAMDLGKMLAKLDLVEGLQDGQFHVWRETRGMVRQVQALYLGAAAAVIASTLITLAGPALVRYAIDSGVAKNDRHPLVVATIVFLVSPENRVTRGAIVSVYGKS